MSASCQIIPLVNKKPSRLYQDLLGKTANNRPLTNLLYAISKQDKIIKMVGYKGLDKLGEIKLEELNKLINIDELLPLQSKILVLEKEFGVVDNKGFRIYYKTPNEIYDKVLDFNEKHKNFTATIEWNESGYYIKIDSITAKNYLQNYFYKRNKARFERLNKYLYDVTRGKFNTFNYGDDIQKSFNFLHLQHVVNFIVGKGFEHEWRTIYNNDILNVVKHWMYNDAFLTRLRTSMNGETEEIKEDKINRLLMRESLNEKDRNTINIDDIENLDVMKELADGFLKHMNDELNKIYYKNFIDALQEAENAVVNDKQLFEVDTNDIRSTLTNLYHKYHINEEVQLDSFAQLKNLKDMCDKLIRSRIKALRLIKNSKEEDFIKGAVLIQKYQSEIEQARYGNSIQSMLNDINAQLGYFMQQISKDENKTIDNIDIHNLKELSVRAELLNQIFDFLYENEEILETCTHIHELQKQTEDDATSKEILDEIANVSKTMRESLSNLKRYAIENRIETVYSYLKLYWGEEDIKINGKNYTSLRQLLEVAEKDPNMIERFILSMGQCSDPILGLVYESTLEAKRRMNAKFSKCEYMINEITNTLYESGSDSSFCFEYDENGIPTGTLISNINWKKWKDDIKAYRKSLEVEGKYTKQQIDRLVEKWKRDNMEDVDLFNGSKQFSEILKRTAETIYGTNVPEYVYRRKIKLPKAKTYSSDRLDRLTQPQREYYYQMMALKFILSRDMPFNDVNIFKAVQIAGNTIDQIKTADGVFGFIRNKVKDVLERREDDTEYGYEDNFVEMLSAQGIELAQTDANNHIIKHIPIFFSNTLKDKRRLSTNMSQAMFAWVAGAIQYEEMNSVSDLMLLTQNFLTDHKTGRKLYKQKGGKRLIDIFTFDNKKYSNPVIETNVTNADSMLYDFYEKNLYGKSKKASKTVNIFGVNVSLDKAADMMTRYTSFTGLAVNVMGAQANLLVGKLQMVIEASAGEFFNLKNFAVAEVKYYQMLPELMNELNSNNKKSKLQLLGDYFDVTDDFLQKVREKGFNKNALKRILTNPNFLFMYGLGEHVLHYQTMLAVMDHVRVRNKKTSMTSSILDCFDVELSKSRKNGQLKINFEDYELVTKNKEGQEEYQQLTQEHIDRVRKQIKYCNTTMHGAFGDIDRGVIHQYAAGRMFMNFRQWMPAHYARRFQGNHYDADLGEFRKGYYVSCWEFLKGIFTDKKLFFNMKASWAELSDVDKNNIKRARAECVLLVMLCAEIACMGTYKDKKGNWAYRNLMYQLRRMRMETYANVPFTVVPFVSNLLNILNSPFASISAFKKASSLLNVTNLFKEVEGGKHKGENLWVHNAHKNAPIVGQIKSQLIDFTDEDYLFNIFN
ncbi:MAG: hypothetical protein IJ180_11535 [Bacteroidales bacterium]|nr:hypothetical protein [Bacteroidales bacterium]